jgi:hypothetical protein
MEGSHGDNGFESRKLVCDAKDSHQSTRLNEEERDVRMIKAGHTPRYQ